jgi:hypothetical protein
MDKYALGPGILYLILAVKKGKCKSDTKNVNTTMPVHGAAGGPGVFQESKFDFGGAKIIREERKRENRGRRPPRETRGKERIG